MKKLTTLLSVVFLAFSISGCGARLVNFTNEAHGNGKYGSVVAERWAAQAERNRKFLIEQGIVTEKPPCEEVVRVSKKNERAVIQRDGGHLNQKAPRSGNQFDFYHRIDATDCSLEFQARRRAGEDYQRAIARFREAE